jgi:hypothetical protein
LFGGNIEGTQPSDHIPRCCHPSIGAESSG